MGAQGQCKQQKQNQIEAENYLNHAAPPLGKRYINWLLIHH